MQIRMLMRSSNTRSISQNQSPSGVRSRGSVTPRRGRTKGGGGELELAPIASLRMSMSASAISVQRLYGGAKSVAPRFEIPELVERGTSGGEQHHIARPGGLRRMPHGGKIGRASCRVRVCQYVEIAVGAVSLKKKKIQ